VVEAMKCRLDAIVRPGKISDPVLPLTMVAEQTELHMHVLEQVTGLLEFRRGKHLGIQTSPREDDLNGNRG
jgi:hypothetical protein